VRPASTSVNSRRRKRNHDRVTAPAAPAAGFPPQTSARRLFGRATRAGTQPHGGRPDACRSSPLPWAAHLGPLSLITASPGGRGHGAAHEAVTARCSTTPCTLTPCGAADPIMAVTSAATPWGPSPVRGLGGAGERPPRSRLQRRPRGRIGFAPTRFTGPGSPTSPQRHAHFAPKLPPNAITSCRYPEMARAANHSDCGSSV
jgi:hypothetical protein